MLLVIERFDTILSNAPSNPTDASAPYERALAFVFGRLNYERHPGQARSLRAFNLERMVHLLDKLGNPQNHVPTVHIAGSKGKGSTASMVASIAQAAGYRAGLFTSPHLAEYEERFTIGGRKPTAEQIVTYVQQVRHVVEEMDRDGSHGHVTFFEISTAIGWLHFLAEKVDLAVMEVGLGGRLDSTNVCQPLVTIITSISRDHTRLLGDTLAQIARQKAGIIKPGVPIVSGVADAEAQTAIEEVAIGQDAPLFQCGRDFYLKSRSVEGPLVHYDVDVEFQSRVIAGLRLGLPGQHQTTNAACAVVASRLLNERGYEISDEQIRSGLAQTRCPSRIEIVHRNPMVILDVAHNIASIQALSDVITHIQDTPKVCIVSISQEKDAAEMLQILSTVFDHLVLTEFQSNPRAISLADLEQLATNVECEVLTAAEPRTAIEVAQELAGSSGLICATGSFFLVAEVQEIIPEVFA